MINTSIEKIQPVGMQVPILTAEELADRECRRTNLLHAIRDANRFLMSHDLDYYSEHGIKEPISVTERPTYTGVTVHSLGITHLIPKYATPENLLNK